MCHHIIIIRNAYNSIDSITGVYIGTDFINYYDDYNKNYKTFIAFPGADYEAVTIE